MTPPPTILDAVFGHAWLREPRRRRIGAAIAALALAILSVFPRHYVAKAQLAPDDSGSALSSLLSSAASGVGGLLSLGALFGSHQSIDEDLAVAKSEAVVRDVIRRLRQEGRLPPGDDASQEVRLRRRVDLETIRGNILEIKAHASDRAFALAVARDYSDAIRARLAQISLDQTAQKKVLALNRLVESSSALARAQGDLDRFRIANKLAAPEQQLGAAVVVVTGLQARLQAVQTQLQTVRRFATGANVQVQALEAEAASLQAQIATAQAGAAGAQGTSLGSMSPKITEYENLYRNAKVAEAEYLIYQRYLDTVVADELSAGITMDVIEPPYVDPKLHLNLAAFGALILVVLSALFAEVYVPPSRRHS